jgi:hypothetical protein
MSDRKSKAELFQMLAEAARNTQPPNLSRSAKRNPATHDLLRSARSKSKEFAARTETLRR